MIRLENEYNRVRRLSRPRRLKRREFEDIVSSTYLEFVFGLKPLISDTRDIAEALARYQDERSGNNITKERARGKGKEEKSLVTYSNNQLPGFTNWKLQYSENSRTRTEYGVEYVCGLKATRTVADAPLARLRELLGFTPENFVPALWEVLPFSWLADYFVNVGDIIEAGCTSTSNVTWISKSVKTQTTREIKRPVDVNGTRTYLGTYGYSLVSASGDFGSNTTQRTTLLRTVPAAIPIPPLVVSYPESISKLANMAAVFLQRKNLSFRF